MHNCQKHEKIFFSFYSKQLKPFVSQHVLSKLPKLTDLERSFIYDNLFDPGTPSSVVQPIGIGNVSKKLTLYTHQLKGFEWLLYMFDRGMHPILADEMGLGKTIQTITCIKNQKKYFFTITFIASLKLDRKLPGTFLIIVPLSVISNWMIEIQRWCPTLRAVRLHVQRDRIRDSIIQDMNELDIVVTTYETSYSSNNLAWCCVG
eukprot:GSMAST32.ASY1.ANO1.2027.1 assembled CDS